MDELTTADGRRLVYHRTGRGPTLVCHGGGPGFSARYLGKLGGLDEQLERGEFAPLRDWLGERIHAQGRRYPPQELLRRATGSTIDARPYLAYLKRKFGAPVAA